VNENVLMIVLRLIHIISGVFWAGTAMSIAWFILPTQRALGQPGMAFTQELMFRRRLRAFALGAMALTILSGLTMYARLAMLNHGVWASSTTGIVLGIGAVAAIIAGGIGGGVIGRIGKKMMKLGAAIQAAGGQPSEAQRAEMQALQMRVLRLYRITAVLVLIAVATMASARYL
jgi:uncharacterized membrane protein